MIIAQNKIKNDISGYVLYMWQIEDLIRAAGLNMEMINSTLVAKYQQPEPMREKISHWYENLVEMMKNEKKQGSGHLQVLVNTVNDMYQMHLKLLKSPEEVAYKHLYNTALPAIKELEEKIQPKPAHEVELMLVALYNAFALKLKGQELSSGTTDALKVFGSVLSLLSKKYRDEQEGKLNAE